MRLVSFDDTVPGVFAFGEMPIGIVAVGRMPVGVLAIGILSVGVVAASAGLGAGLVSVSCGIGVGGVTWGFGVGVGLWSATSPLGLGVLRRRTEKLPPLPGRSKFDVRVSETAVAVERLSSGELSEGWVVLEAELAGGGKPRLVLGGAPLELARPTLAEELRRLSPEDRRVLAHLVAVERPDPAAAGGDYRAAATTKRTLVCDALVTKGKAPGPPVERSVRRLDARGAVWRGPLWLALAIGTAYVGLDRLADLELDRRAEVVFPARVASTTHARVAAGAPCTIRAWLRTDGRTRRRVAAEVRCGEVVLYPRTSERSEVLEERPLPDRPGELAYRIQYADPGQRPSRKVSARPALSFESRSGRAVVEGLGDPPFRVELEAGPESAPRRGTPLLFENLAAPRGDTAVRAQGR